MNDKIFLKKAKNSSLNNNNYLYYMFVEDRFRGKRLLKTKPFYYIIDIICYEHDKNNKLEKWLIVTPNGAFVLKPKNILK